MELPPALAREMPFRRVEAQGAGARLSVVDHGGGSGETLLFVHGNPTWSYLWRALVRPAAEAGHRCLAPDLAGFGASEKPRDPAYYSLTRHIENLEAVAKALDVRDATLVLHDWGGPIGMGFAVRNPDRVKRVAVCNTVAFPPRHRRAFTAWHRAFASWPGYRLGVAFDLVRRTAMRYGVRRPLPPEAAAAYAWPMKDKGARIAAGRFVQMVPDGPDHPEAETLRIIEANFHRLKDKPFLVLWADRDPVMPPRYASKWVQAFPQAEVSHVAPDAGHFWQEDAPERFLPRLLAFADHAPTPSASAREAK